AISPRLAISRRSIMAGSGAGKAASLAMAGRNGSCVCPPGGRALVEKGIQAFLALGADPQTGDGGFACAAQLVAELARAGLAQQRLGRAHRLRAVLQQL